MIATPTGPRTPPLDSSRSALDFIHGHLILPAEQANLDESPLWTLQLEHGIRQQRMDAAARIVRRLAHDFGNILTGILGFSELALDQAAPNSPEREYLSEIHRSAQSGAQYINQLRLFARQQTNSNHSCKLARVLGECSGEWRTGSVSCRVECTANPAADVAGSPLATRADVQLNVHVPDDLPAVALDAEALRQVLTILLDNAREAIAGAGVVDISVRTVQMSVGEAGALFGEVRPGKHLEICIADNGAGLTPEVQRQLFAEPFFSTKSRKRGFGLAMAYGILSASGGGLELLPRPEGGTIARLVVPVAAVAEPSF